MRRQFNRIFVVAGSFLSSGVVPVSAKKGRHVEGGLGGLRTRRIVVNKNPMSAIEPNGKRNGGGIIDEEDIEFWTRILDNGSLPVPIIPPMPTPVETPNPVAISAITTYSPSIISSPDPTTYSPSISSPSPTTNTPTVGATTLNPTNTPTVGATTLSPTNSCGLTPSERRSLITEKLIEVSLPGQLNLSNTPQSNAFGWIVDDDAAQLCPDDASLIQRYVLAVFYYSTSGDGWFTCSAPAEFDQASIDLANALCNLTTTNATVLFPNDVRGTDAWLTAGSECLWGGVSCYGTDSGSDAFKLSVVEFEENGLSGTLPTEMEALTSLRFFALERGSISGTIPSSFGNLKSLLLLDLDFNYLTGTLPDSLWTIDGLRQLDLNDNYFSGTLSDDIALLQELRFFQIDNNYMMGTIPTSMGSIPNFSECLFYRCVVFLRLQPFHLSSVSSSIAYILGLIGLSGNGFTGSVASELCGLRPSPLQTLVVDCIIECDIPECCTSCVPPSTETTIPATTMPAMQPPLTSPPKFNVSA